MICCYYSNYISEKVVKLRVWRNFWRAVYCVFLKAHILKLCVFSQKCAWNTQNADQKLSLITINIFVILSSHFQRCRCFPASTRRRPRRCTACVRCRTWAPCWPATSPYSSSPTRHRYGAWGCKVALALKLFCSFYNEVILWPSVCGSLAKLIYCRNNWQLRRDKLWILGN